ncbi:hypothetical protein RMATCC62417_17122 [Rhizopus microsporus]|nr:hypothetical protein RMATCC62417_17122 [Rhizopus microsporus]
MKGIRKSCKKINTDLYRLSVFSKAVTTKYKLKHIFHVMAVDVDASLLIKKDPVLYAFDPEGDGWCGYRAVAEMVEKNENMLPGVKEKILHAFEKYKNVYLENFWFQDLDRLKKNIENGIDWTTTTR